MYSKCSVRFDVLLMDYVKSTSTSSSNVFLRYSPLNLYTVLCVCVCVCEGGGGGGGGGAMPVPVQSSL